MPRGKVNLRPITCAKKRAATFKQRKEGLFKKASDLSILCDIDVCAVVYDGSLSSDPHVFSSVPDVSSLVSRFSIASEKGKGKGLAKGNMTLQKQLEAKRAEVQKLESENRERMRSMSDTINEQLIVVRNRIRQLQHSESSVGPVPIMSERVEDWMVPPFGRTHASSVGPLGEVLQLQNWSLPPNYMWNGIMQISSDMEELTNDVPAGLEGQLNDIVSSFSDIIGSVSDTGGSTVINSFDSEMTVQETNTEISLDGSRSGSENCLLEVNPYEYMDTNELFESMDASSVGSFNLESISSFDFESIGIDSGFESVGSVDRQELSDSNFVGSVDETSTWLNALEKTLMEEDTSELNIYLSDI